jgi:hypothetical protein
LKRLKATVIFVILLFFSLMAENGKILAQNVNMSGEIGESDTRVIYEQSTSYEDALLMKKKIEQMEQEKEEKKSPSTVGHPLLDAINQNAESGEKYEMIEFLRKLLQSLGVDQEVPVPVPVDEQLNQLDRKSYEGGNGLFKRWEDRHEWKGLRSRTK